MDDFKYDVAFSFLSPDEPLAREAALELGDRARVFVYSERQRELAGEDGADQFSSVFGREARICVVLYRDGWGRTPWTGVEESAIKNRGLTHGWSFLLVISLDGTAPIWLPRTQLWLGWQEFGIRITTAVIGRKITEHGGELRVLDAADHAARIGAERRREAERDLFLNSEAGVKAAHEELEAMFDHLESQVARASTVAPHLQVQFFRRGRDRVVAVASPGCTVTFGWSLQWGNVLRGSSLLIRQIAGFHSFDHFDVSSVVTSRVHATFTLDDAGEPAWTEEDQPARFYSSRSLAERYLRVVIDHAGDEPRFERQLGGDAEWG